MTTGSLPNARSDDRVFVLEPINPDKKVLQNNSLTDPRLFTGVNKIHAKKDPETCLWFLKYDLGVVPEALKCQFTSFTAARRFTEAYYATRNLKVVEVRD